MPFPCPLRTARHRDLTLARLAGVSRLVFGIRCVGFAFPRVFPASLLANYTSSNYTSSNYASSNYASV